MNGIILCEMEFKFGYTCILDVCLNANWRKVQEILRTTNNLMHCLAAHSLLSGDHAVATALGVLQCDVRELGFLNLEFNFISPKY